jgi:hypothetical protein
MIYIYIYIWFGSPTNASILSVSAEKNLKPIELPLFLQSPSKFKNSQFNVSNF